MQPFSQRLTEWTNEGEKVFNHLLGYVIAFTSLVAFADVLGNGQVSEHLPVLFWIWVFAQGLCVEFQVFILIKRMPGYWNTNRVMFGVYAGFIASLCLMSILIGSVFVQHDQEHGTVEQAMASLGIPHIGFIYARAALAILLVALIAIDRAIEQHQMSSIQVPSVPRPLQDEPQIIRQLAQITQEQERFQIALETLGTMLTQTLACMEQVERSAQVPDAAMVPDVEPIREPMRPHLELVSSERAGKEPQVSNGVADFIETFQLQEGRVPTLSEIMEATGCSKSTASRTRAQVKEQTA